LKGFHVLFLYDAFSLLSASSNPIQSLKSFSCLFIFLPLRRILLKVQCESPSTDKISSRREKPRGIKVWWENRNKRWDCFVCEGNLNLGIEIPNALPPSFYPFQCRLGAALWVSKPLPSPSFSYLRPCQSPQVINPFHALYATRNSSGNCAKSIVRSPSSGIFSSLLSLFAQD